MARKTIIVVWLVALALAPFRLAEAQQAKKVHRIGYLTSNTSSAELPRFDAFRQALRELGHVEGQNITIEYRYAEGGSIGSPASLPSWSVSRLTYLSGSRRMLFKPPRTLPERSPSFLLAFLILLRLSWLTAWHGLGKPHGVY